MLDWIAFALLGHSAWARRRVTRWFQPLDCEKR